MSIRHKRGAAGLLLSGLSVVAGGLMLAAPQAATAQAHVAPRTPCKIEPHQDVVPPEVNVTCFDGEFQAIAVCEKPDLPKQYIYSPVTAPGSTATAQCGVGWNLIDWGKKGGEA